MKKFLFVVFAALIPFISNGQYISFVENNSSVTINLSEYDFATAPSNSTVKLFAPKGSQSTVVAVSMTDFISRTNGEWVQFTAYETTGSFAAGQKVAFRRGIISKISALPNGKGKLLYGGSNNFTTNETYSLVKSTILTAPAGGSASSDTIANNQVWANLSGSTGPATGTNLSDISAALTPFSGTNGSTSGAKGGVPAPTSSQYGLPLMSTGSFATVAPDWANGLKITQGMLVVYQGGLYRCNTTHTATSTFDSAKLDGVFGSQEVTTTVGSATFSYKILTGTPTISYTKTAGSGVGTMTVSGGTIKLIRFMDLITTSDVDGNSEIRLDLVGTGTNAILARPQAYKEIYNTANPSVATNLSVYNQIDIDNTPQIGIGDFVTSGQGSMSARVKSVAASYIIGLTW